MKIGARKTFSYLGLLVVPAAIILAPMALMFGPFNRTEQKASAAIRGLSSWTEKDCATVWNEAKILSNKFGSGKTVKGNDVPEPMRRVGFRSAYVSSSEFRGRHGGSSFGSTGALVTCYFDGLYGSEPFMGYSGGRFYPDGRWEPYQ